METKQQMVKAMENIEDNINALNAEGYTPLHCAIKNKHIHTVQYLLDNKADVNKMADDGRNSVHFACQHADIGILYLLITRGGDVNAKNREGKTPTMIAAMKEKDGCISLLATAGANLDQKDDEGQVPLIIAAIDGHTNTVKQLITNGASYDVTDKSGHSALESAIIKKHDGAATIMIRLVQHDWYLSKLIEESKIDLCEIVENSLKETLKALLDRMVIRKDLPNAKRSLKPYVVETGHIDLETKKISDKVYQNNKTFLLKQIRDLEDEDIAYNGTIRVLVDEKMRKYGYVFLGIKISFNILFLLALAYCLIQASYEKSPNKYNTKNPRNNFRIFTELCVLLYLIFIIIIEGVELFRVARLTFSYAKEKKNDKGKNKNCEDAPISKVEEMRKKFKDTILIQIFTDYLTKRTI